MKVRINITVEVDENDWMLNYGMTTKAEVREDVNAYIADAVTQAPVPMIPVSKRP